MHQITSSTPHENASQEANIVQKKNNGTYQSLQGKKAPIQAKQRLVQRKQKPKPHKAKQRPVQRKQAYQPHQAKQQPVQRNAQPKPDNDLKTQMGNQYGVNLSGFKEHQNSSFPGSVGAVATIQGKDIHYAPGQYTTQNRKHELGHAIDNTVNGTPKGDKVVNGQTIDTTREKAADKIAETPIQRKETASLAHPTQTKDTVIQRQVKWDKPSDDLRDIGDEDGFGKAKKLVDIFKDDPAVVLISTKSSKNNAIKDIKDTILDANVDTDGLLSRFLDEVITYGNALGPDTVYGGLDNYDEMRAGLGVECLKAIYGNFDELFENEIERNGDFTDWGVWSGTVSDYMDINVADFLNIEQHEDQETRDIVGPKLRAWLNEKLLDGADDKESVTDFVDFAASVDDTFGKWLIEVLANNIAHHWITNYQQFIAATPDHAQLKADIIANLITRFTLSTTYNTAWGPGAEFLVDAPGGKQTQYDQKACVHTHYDNTNNLTMAHAKLWHKRKQTGGTLQIIPLGNISGIALAGAANGATQVGHPYNQL